jgi:hypothetical protein
MKRTAFAFTSLAILCACVRESAPSASRAAPPREQPPTQTAPSKVADAGECPVDSAGRYADPVALVRVWSDSDRVGGTMGGNQWAAGTLSCVERASSDMIYVTGPFTIRRLTSSRDTVTIERTYRRHYTVEYDSAGVVMQLAPSEADVADTVRVIRMPLLAWRIDAIAGGAHLAADIALARLTRLDSLGRDRLRELSL